ncbi:hypothetical protein SELMODRAFT_424829 [Selaginella moellendorffii]|uniref:Secreted protein n=1 Tax=Selaginella moellendorffii TaxID=88036 RepID=D8SR54_SELML|nr:hypothetical protein SELMODRAFT_424829 [Selaginella moellendorffii]
MVSTLLFSFTFHVFFSSYAAGPCMLARLPCTYARLFCFCRGGELAVPPNHQRFEAGMGTREKRTEHKRRTRLKQGELVEASKFKKWKNEVCGHGEKLARGGVVIFGRNKDIDVVCVGNVRAREMSYIRPQCDSCTSSGLEKGRHSPIWKELARA